MDNSHLASLPRPFQENSSTFSLYASPFIRMPTTQCNGQTTNQLLNSSDRIIRTPRCHLPFRCSKDTNLVLKSEPITQHNISTNIAIRKKNTFFTTPVYGVKRKAFYCDTCDRGFNAKTELDEHLTEHITCWVDGCSFKAHIKIVEKHIKMQHESGLAKRIGQLDTADDIQKWREERKKNFPTALRQAESKTCTAEKPTFQKPFGRKGKRGQVRSWPPAEMPKNGYPFPRGQDKKFKKRCKGNLNKPRGPHTNTGVISNMISLTSDNELGDISPTNSENFEKKSRENSVDPLQFCIDEDDDEGPEEVPIEKGPGATPQLSNALASLINNYASEDEENQENNSDTVVQVVSVQEKPISKRKNRQEKQHNKRNKVKKFQPKFQIKERQVSLLEKLLAPEIKKERDNIFQCIQYIVKNNFFDKE